MKNEPDVWTDTIVSISNGLINGFSTNQHGRVKEWFKSEKPLWIWYDIRTRYDMIGFNSVPKSKLIEFEDLVDEYLKDAVDYLIDAAYSDKAEMPELTINWILGPIAEIMNERKIKGPLSAVCPSDDLNKFLIAMLDGKFNKSKSKDAFRDFIVDSDLTALINNDKYKLADQNIVNDAINAAIANNPEQFEKAKTDPKLVNWLVGQVMKSVAGKAKAPEVREAFLARLNA